MHIFVILSWSAKDSQGTDARQVLGGACEESLEECRQIQVQTRVACLNMTADVGVRLAAWSKSRVGAHLTLFVLFVSELGLVAASSH